MQNIMLPMDFFVVVNSDIIKRNTIVETKNIEFFEHIFSLKINGTSEQSRDIASDTNV